MRGWRRNWSGAKLRAWLRREPQRTLRWDPRRTIFLLRWRRGETAWVSPLWICLRENFGLRNFLERAQCGGSRRSWSSCELKNFCMDPRLRCLKAPRHSRASLVRTAGGGCPYMGHLPRLRWMTGFLRLIMRFPCSKIILASYRSRDSGWRGEPQRLALPARSCITCARPSADRWITSIASAGTSGRTAWCWTW